MKYRLTSWMHVFAVFGLATSAMIKCVGAWQHSTTLFHITINAEWNDREI